jgi:hypothetical protein
MEVIKGIQRTGSIPGSILSLLTDSFEIVAIPRIENAATSSGLRMRCLT